MRLTLLCLAILLLTLTVPLAAQNAVAPKSDAATLATDTTPPTAVPLSEIPARAEASQARLDEIRQLLPRERAIGQIRDAYAATQDTIQALMELQSRPGQERPTKRSLTDMHNEWARRISQMREWQKTVGDRTNVLSGVQGELTRREQGWRLTKAEATKADAAPDVVELVDGVIRGTVALEDSVALQLGEVIRLQAQITRTLATLQQMDERINEQLASARRNLLRLDSPPLWKGLRTADAGQGLAATLAAGVTRTQRELGYFFEAYRLRIYLHLASTLAILLAVFWFRGKLEPHTTEQPAYSARRVLDHPAAGSLLAIALAGLVFYPRAPLSVYDLALLATVPAVLRLLPSFLPPYLIRPAIAASLLFAIQRTGTLLLAGSGHQRPGSLALAIAGAAGLLWLLRKGGEFEAMGAHSYARALRGAARLSAAALLVAATSNVVGNVSLGMFLTSGVLSSSYLLLVVVTAVRVADGVLIVSTRSQAAGVSRYVAQRKDTLVRSGLRLINLSAAVGWIILTLWIFDLLDPTFAFVSGILAASLSVGELHLSLGAVLLFLFTVWVSVLVSRGLSGLLEVDVLSRLDMPRGLPSVIGRLTRYTLISLGFFSALAAIGVDIGQLTLIGGALGVGIGFGLQNIVSNFVSGLILAFERPIREGDQIQLQALTGEVRRIGFRATVVRTFDGAEVIVPNATLISQDVINWTLSDQQRRITVSVGVAYGSDPARVKALLLDVPGKFPAVLRTPEPFALFTGFGDSALNFELRFWTTDADRVAILKSDVTTAVNDALVSAGIEIPFPQRDLHIRSVDGAAATQLRGPAGTDKEAT
ncbi:MAG TPA: mechanosensitive ion channel [Gemmatimonadales bacterium]|nr:mechanosensitive ion channel [Gemmatimonadales bacterium]HRZ08580.1 mechanosensitive ion channel [Gemmatimonadales bacterium]